MAQARLCWSRFEVPGVPDHPATILSTFWTRVSAGTVSWMLESRRHAYGRLPCQRGPEAQGLVPTLPSVPEAQGLVPTCTPRALTRGGRPPHVCTWKGWRSTLLLSLQKRSLAGKGWRSTLLPSLQTSWMQTSHSDAVFWTSGGARSKTPHLAECLVTKRWRLAECLDAQRGRRPA